jgi:hypothetical protein
VAELDDWADRYVHETAQPLLEVAAGVVQSDAASVWRFDDEGVHLVARFPADRTPTVEVFTAPEIARSIRAAENRFYVRDDEPDPVRAWMQENGLAVSLRLPVETPEVQRHFLGLSWETADHPPIETLLPTARRFADHIALALARIAGRRVRHESALELSDNVAQALVIAKSSLHLEEHAVAEQAIDRALAETRRIMGQLMDDDPRGNQRRLYPSDVLGGGDASAPPDA